MSFGRILVLSFISFNSVHLVLSAASGINEFTAPRSWLRLCQSGTVLGAEPGDRCPSGFWFKKPQKIGCACGHGVWVFAKGWCDRQAKVIVALNGTCFSVDKEVRYIRSIGYSNDAFAPYHFQTTVGFEYVQSIPGGFEYSYSNFKYDQHLGAIFRVNDLESTNSYNCLSRNDPAKRALAMKYFTEKVPFQQTEECFKVARRNASFLYDEGYGLNEYFVMKEKNKGGAGPKSYINGTAWKGDGAQCATTCLGNGTNAANGTDTAAGNSTGTFPPEFFDPDTDYQNITVPDFYTPCNTSLQMYNLTNKTLREIHEQTKRMILTNLASSMKRVVTPKVNSPDYLLFQLSRGIFEKVCPDEYIPHDLVLQLHRMFRVAVKESLRIYPYDLKGDANRTDRITTALKTCLDTAKPFYIEPVTTTTPAPPGNSTNATAPPPPPPPTSNGSCPGEIDKFIYAYDDANTTLRTLLTSMPPDLVTNVNKLDLATEAAWKTVMVTHYYCARHFVQNGTDFSSYYDKMEMFFNRWIQHRWFSPGLSTKAYAYALSTYDLEKFAKNLDMCVSATKSMSSHRKWIKRPVTIRHCGGRTFQELENMPKNTKDPILDAIRPQTSTFNNEAYCLPHWHTPASNPGIDYDPSKDSTEPGCITYNRQEWEDSLTPDFTTGWTNHL